MLLLLRVHPNPDVPVEQAGILHHIGPESWAPGRTAYAERFNDALRRSGWFSASSLLFYRHRLSGAALSRSDRRGYLLGCWMPRSWRRWLMRLARNGARHLGRLVIW